MPEINKLEHNTWSQNDMESEFKRDPSKFSKISSLNKDYDVLSNHTGIILAQHRQTGAIHMRVSGKIVGDNNLQITKSMKTPNTPIHADELISHLTMNKHFNSTISDSSLSPRAANVYKRLTSNKGVTVTHVADNKPIKLNTKEWDSNFHSNEQKPILSRFKDFIKGRPGNDKLRNSKFIVKAT